MPISIDTLAALATILGTGLSVFGLVQSRAWLILISVMLLLVALGIGWYARQKRTTLRSASTVVEGHSIDSLNIANLRRRVNRTFVVQESHHIVRIKGEDLEITWKYRGFSRANNVSSMEFSIDSDESTPFAQLDCVAFDLGHDPEMRHRISPVLLGTEGISKKVSVTFLEPLYAQQPFGVLLRCRLPRCLKAGFGYYTSTLSFAQARVPRSVIHMQFEGPPPNWVRVYESEAGGPNKLVKTLAPNGRELGLHEYVDVVEGRAGRSARVYAFWRDSV